MVFEMLKLSKSILPDDIFCSLSNEIENDWNENEKGRAPLR